MQNEYTATPPSRDALDAMQGASVIEFGTSWCGHCQRAQPLIEAASALHSDVPYLRVEDGPGRRLGRSFRVKLWPTLIFMRDGVEVSRLVRPTSSAAILEAFETVDPGKSAQAARRG